MVDCGLKNKVANIITGSRIVLSLPLLFIPLSSVWFYALYLLCGLSDMIDGTVARRTSSASEFGARLDTVTGLLLLLLPVTISFIDLTYTLPIVCTIATVAAIHEVYFTYWRKNMILETERLIFRSSK